jgi:hypothetical protein
MPANRRIPPRPAAEARRDLASESQSMRYLTRCHSAEEAAPIERAVAEFVSRLILFRKPMERGSDFIRLGASAAGGLMVWSEFLLDRMIGELRHKAGRRSRSDAVEEEQLDWALPGRPLSMVRLNGEWVGENDLVLCELVDPDELATPVERLVFTPLIQDYSAAQPVGARHLAVGPAGRAGPEPLPYQTNAAYLAEGLGLDAAGGRLLELIGLCVAAPWAVAGIGGHRGGRLQAHVARVLGRPVRVRRRLTIESLYRPDSLLRRCGVLESNQDPGVRHHLSTFDDLLTCHNLRVRAAMTQTFDSAQAFFASFLSPALPTQLDVPDVQHLARFTELALPTLRNAGAQAAPGLNILLYGPPGTGKTEYAKLLAREAGLQLFEVECEDGDGAGLNTSDRLGSLMLALQSLKGRRDAMVLLDEAEDVFPDSGSFALHQLFGLPRASSKREQGKAWMHRLLERMAVPVVWTTNSASAPSTRRRLRRFLAGAQDGRAAAQRQAPAGGAVPGWAESARRSAGRDCGPAGNSPRGTWKPPRAPWRWPRTGELRSRPAPSWTNN